MICARAWAGKHYAVYGLARSGLATVEALLASGARVTAWDEREEARENLRLSRAKSKDTPPGASTSLGTNGLVIAPLDDFTPFDSLILSPGVPLNTHLLAARARKAGLEIIGDIELFARARPELPPHKVVGITGTNGKSTTTALVHHILREAGVPTTMGGNIGLPILAQEPLPEGGVYVLELSSFQIDLTQSLDCDVAVLLNITPDHLDRYESFEAYQNSKLRLFHMQAISEPDHAAIFGGSSDPEHRNEYEDQLIALIPNNTLLLALDYLDRQQGWPALEGPHNHQNAACAIAVAEVLGLDLTVVEQALQTYPGLPHRMERTRKLNGVLFVNDSKATNSEAAAPALAAYPRVRWIVGGQAKTHDLGDTATHLDHVVHAYTIGEAGPLFACLLREQNVAVTESETLENAVNRAAADSQAGETVLLSPACASFDQFKDFEARGDAFKALVGAL